MRRDGRYRVMVEPFAAAGGLGGRARRRGARHRPVPGARASAASIADPSAARPDRAAPGQPADEQLDAALELVERRVLDAAQVERRLSHALISWCGPAAAGRRRRGGRRSSRSAARRSKADGGRPRPARGEAARPPTAPAPARRTARLRRDVGAQRAERLGLARLGRASRLSTPGRALRVAVLADAWRSSVSIARRHAAQQPVGGEEEPARLGGSRPRARAHEAPDDLAEHQRRLGRRRVDADAQARDVDALGDHVHRDDPALASTAANARSLRAARASVWSDDDGRAAGDLAQQRGHAPRVAAVGGDDEPAGVAVRRRPRSSPSFSSASPQDPRQPVGELGRDRRPVAAARLAGRSARARTTTRSRRRRCPRQRPVVGDEADRPADPVADGVGVPVADVGHRDRRRRSARRRSASRRSETASPRAAASGRWPRNGSGERPAPGQLLAEVVRLVGDDERPRR